MDLSEALVWLAQANGGDVSSVFLQYGALGAIALLALLAVRVLFQREVKALDLERAARARSEEEVRQLNLAIQTQYVTTLTEATRVMSNLLDSYRGHK